jgi:nucleoside diphosphate kinase
MENKALEQTLVLIKPDALKNSLTGYVLSLLAEFHTGLCFAGAKIVHVNRMLAMPNIEASYFTHHCLTISWGDFITPMSRRNKE